MHSNFLFLSQCPFCANFKWLANQCKFGYETKELLSMCVHINIIILLNLLWNKHGEIFHPYTKFSVVWIPIEMTGFRLQKTFFDVQYFLFIFSRFISHSTEVRQENNISKSLAT